MPSPFTLRPGQAELQQYLQDNPNLTELVVQWPTGYGKSLGFALAWKHMVKEGRANRLLLIVANNTQRTQIVNDFASDCRLAGAPVDVNGKSAVADFDGEAYVLRMCDQGSALIFVTTIHMLSSCWEARGGSNTIKDLLMSRGTKWMVGFDEIQHYQEERAWGKAVQQTKPLAKFVLAMSATPYTRNGEIVFSEPTLKTTYAVAADGGVVKNLLGKDYDYKVTLIHQESEPVVYETHELIEQARDDFDAWLERGELRFSHQYIEPILSFPLARLDRACARYPEVGLQMLVMAMSVKHAKCVCEKIRKLRPGIQVDWVGTGKHGRSTAENEEVLAKFCPPKEKTGKRPKPTLDVLVQVAMAGEGFDSINVVEIVDLFPWSAENTSWRSTRMKQFYGRASRVIEIKKPDGTAVKVNVDAHVNVPTDHPLGKSAWLGMLNEWMDVVGDAEPAIPVPPPRDKDEDEDEDNEPWENVPQVRQIEFLGVSEAVQRYPDQFKKFSRSVSTERPFPPYNDGDWLKEQFTNCFNWRQQEFSEQDHRERLRVYLDASIGKLAFLITRQTQEVSGTTVGNNEKLINSKIKKMFGKPRSELVATEMDRACHFVKDWIDSMRKAAS
jgi:superfamily II DNA or RNA helicase